MSASIIGSGGIAAKARGLAEQIGASVMAGKFAAGQLTMALTPQHACMLWPGLMTHTFRHTNLSIGVSLPG